MADLDRDVETAYRTPRQAIYIDIFLVSWMMEDVRKWCSLLLMLSFLTAYGRCVADQLGILHGSGTSCCVVICEDIEDSCIQCPDETSPAATQPHLPEDNQEPKPCQLCIIIDADGVVTAEEVRVPSPQFEDHPDKQNTSPRCGQIRGVGSAATGPPHLTLSDHTGQPGEQRAHLLRTLCKALPIRGPSMA